jgi:hypothetical protein
MAVEGDSLRGSGRPGQEALQEPPEAMIEARRNLGAPRQLEACSPMRIDNPCHCSLYSLLVYL